MIHHPSPNAGPRRDGLRPELVVLHFTEMASAEAALARLCDPSAEVSAHYLIGRDGRLWHLVDEEMRAWHAGAGAWRGRGDVNSRSIGIELDNDGRSPFTQPLMARLERLLPGILTRWAIPARGVIAHSDMAPDRKVDPGARFDWQRLARAGVGRWVEPEGWRSGPGHRAPLRPRWPGRWIGSAIPIHAPICGSGPSGCAFARVTTAPRTGRTAPWPMPSHICLTIEFSPDRPRIHAIRSRVTLRN